MKEKKYHEPESYPTFLMYDKENLAAFKKEEEETQRRIAAHRLALSMRRMERRLSQRDRLPRMIF